jgi:hypothetical protein
LGRLIRIHFLFFAPLRLLPFLCVKKNVKTTLQATVLQIFLTQRENQEAQRRKERIEVVKLAPTQALEVNLNPSSLSEAQRGTHQI